MSLLSEIEAAATNRGTICSVYRVREALSKADQADLDTALADNGIAGSQIARALSARGHKVKGDTVQRHRKGDCACGRAR